LGEDLPDPGEEPGWVHDLDLSPFGPNVRQTLLPKDTPKDDHAGDEDQQYQNRLDPHHLTSPLRHIDLKKDPARTIGVNPRPIIAQP
jgi:hypothetical protein